jgi:hypothetical protein
MHGAMSLVGMCVYCCGRRVGIFFLSEKTRLDLKSNHVEVSLLGFQTVNNQSAFDISQFPKRVILNAQAPVSVFNPNLYGIGVRRIEALSKFYLLMRQVINEKTPIGQGALENILFPSKEKMTIYFPFTIQYNPEDNPWPAQVLRNILGSCGALGNAKRTPLKLTVETTLFLSVLEFFKIYPKDCNSFIDS